MALTASPVLSTKAKRQLVFSYQNLFSCSFFFSSILTAIDRGARLTGVPPGLPKRAAAGGATDAHSNLRVAGKTPISSRTKLQVAVAHTVVCRETQELKTPLAYSKNSFLEKGPSNYKIQILVHHYKRFVLILNMKQSLA